MAETPPVPQPPDEGACCGNGCPDCVWTTYYAELTVYRQSMADSDASQAESDRESPCE